MTTETRQERRKARTRQALIEAAKAFLAEGETADPSIQQITERADVGLGSFYNHFATKADLFDAAIADVSAEYARYLRARTDGLSDPAEVFAASVRLTGRMIVTHPRLAVLLSRTGLTLLGSESGMALFARHDIERAVAAGRFQVGNPWVALAGAGGALLGLLHVGLQRPGTVTAEAWDELAEHMLRMFGMPARAAKSVAHRPLPDAPANP